MCKRLCNLALRKVGVPPPQSVEQRASELDSDMSSPARCAPLSGDLVVVDMPIEENAALRPQVAVVMHARWTCDSSAVLCKLSGGRDKLPKCSIRGGEYGVL